MSRGEEMIEMLIGSFISAISTGLGAVPVLFFKELSHKWRDILLAYSAGIMMAATSFGLIPQSLSESNMWILVTGVLCGTVLLTILEKVIPHQDVEQVDSFQPNFDAKAKLVILALCFHNIPEGFSVGVSYTSASQDLGNLIALSIGLQNAPEGLIVALFLLGTNVGRLKAVLIATLTGMIEILAGVIGFLLAHSIGFFVGFGLAFAAGAMLFIVYKELIPESHGHGYERVATYGFVFGILTMLYIMNL